MINKLKRQRDQLLEVFGPPQTPRAANIKRLRTTLFALTRERRRAYAPAHCAALDYEIENTALELAQAMLRLEG